MKSNKYSQGILSLVAMLYLTGIAQAQIEGTVIDGESNDGLPFATVVIQNPEEQEIITGVTTDLEGNFNISGLESGTYDVQISFVGYESQVIEDVAVSENASRRLGNIALNTGSEILDAVVIAGDKQVISTSLEGLEINPEQNIASQGGSVLDVLKNVPSISVDADGNVSIRGASSANILINGRNSSLSEFLDQIAASSVKNISINNNPGAKYDAQGQGGLINIELKEGAEEGQNFGFSGRGSVVYGTQERYNISTGLNYEQSKYRVFTNFDRRRRFRGSNGVTQRTNFETGETFDQRSNQEGYGISNSLNTGVSFFPDQNNTIDFNLVGSWSERVRDQDIFSQVIFDGETINDTRRSSNENRNRNALEVAGAWQHDFEREGERLELSGSMSLNSGQGNETFGSFSNSDGEYENQIASQRSNSDVDNQVIVSQLDYTRPLSNNAKIESGLKSIIRNIDNEFILSDEQPSTGNYVINEGASNRFRYNEAVYAAYTTYSGTFNSLEVYSGLRAEQSVISTELVTTDESNDQNYLSLFPSAKLLYPLGKSQSVKFTYSRRIDRPRSWHLNPFVDVSDSLNIFRGDPNLQPEFINSFELGHQVDFEKFALTSTVFYRRTKNQIDWVSRVQEDGTAFRGPANLDYSNNLGLEFITLANFTDWWSLNASITLFYSDITGTIEGVRFSNSNVTSNAKMTSNFSLPFSLDAQIVFDYEGPEAEAQGNEEARYSFDFALRRSILNDKGFVSFNAMDIFNTLQRTERSSGPNFVQFRERDWASRYVQLGVGYRF
jgi:outer membrane receptor protein involved in Fe transport